MSDIDDENEIIARPNQQGQLTFLEKNRLTATQKTLKRLSIKALKFVEEVLDDEDGVYDTKTKLDVAKFATSKFVEVTDSIQKDSMGRLIAEVRLKGLSAKPNLKDVDGDDSGDAVFTTELLDFDKVNGDVEDDKEVFDAGHVSFKK